MQVIFNNKENTEPGCKEEKKCLNELILVKHWYISFRVCTTDIQQVMNHELFVVGGSDVHHQFRRCVVIASSPALNCLFQCVDVHFLFSHIFPMPMESKFLKNVQKVSILRGCWILTTAGRKAETPALVDVDAICVASLYLGDVSLMIAACSLVVLYLHYLCSGDLG